MEITIFLCRFLYGREKEFVSISFSVEIYKFAHEMQIKSLMVVLDKYFKDEANASDIFTVFDMYQTLNDNEGVAWCKKVMWSKVNKYNKISHKEINIYVPLV
jgi:hypothetical protein